MRRRRDGLRLPRRVRASAARGPADDSSTSSGAVGSAALRAAGATRGKGSIALPHELRPDNLSRAMHYSRFSTVIIDCQTDDVASSAEFWSQAFGRKVAEGNSGSSRYVALTMKPGEILCQVQAVGHESRVHIDIETDDVDAEVKRLCALGAIEIERNPTWAVMEAPTGQRFCVGRPKTKDFPEGANRWA